MTTYDDIRQGLKALCAGPVQTVVAVVKSVDEAKLSMVCTPSGGGADYEDVRLKAAISSDHSGLYPIPEVNTSVLLGIINDDPDTTFLLTAEKVVKIIAKVGDMVMEIKPTEIVFNGGELGGLVKIEPLVSRINNIEGKITQLAAEITALATIFNAHTHIVTFLGVPSGIPNDAQSASTVVATQTTRNMIENEIIKH